MKISKNKSLLILACMLIPFMTKAASFIESQDGAGNKSQIYIEGHQARIDIPSQNTFMIMNLQSKSMHVVLNNERMVMDLSDLFKDSNETATSLINRADSLFENKGPGPVTAGYDTEEYEIFADGKYCGSAFVSVRAMKDIGLGQYAKALEDMSKQAQKKISGMTGMQMQQHVEPCHQAQAKLSDRLQSIGFPLRFIDKNRRLLSVVNRVEPKAQLPANAFVIPANYPVSNPVKMIDTMKKMQPQMQEMLKNMPPEAKEMMQQQLQQMQ